jgi:hypothetical protein
MAANISNVCADLERVPDDAGSAFGALTSEQLNWKPSEKEWSIAQCFEHLIVTNELYFPNIQAVIDGEHRNNLYSKVPFVTDLIAAAMKYSMNPKQRRKMKTFSMFEPSTSDVTDTIIEDFAANQQRLIDMAAAVKHLDISRIKIAEPLSPALNLRLIDAFEILAMHARRHFDQAKRVMETPGFPA